MDVLHAIIGASSALGGRLARDLAKRGFPVAGTYFGTPDPVTDATLWIKCDSTSEADVGRFAEECFKLCSRVSLVYLAGISKNVCLHRMTRDDWLRVQDVTLNGAFLAIREFLRGMRIAGWGRIILAGSVVGRTGTPGTAAYAASKEGLKGLARVAAMENSRRGITVNCLELGYMDAGLTYSIPEPVRDRILRDIPSGMFGSPANLTEAVLFLDAAEYVNGSVLTISGGV